MIRILAVGIAVTLGLAITVEEAAARGGRRSSCGSSCGASSCGTSCGSFRGASSCGSGAVCGPGGCTVHTTAAPSSATLVVTLPADAKLTIDGNATTSTSGTRLFHVPGLESGHDYVYTLRADVVRDGRTQRISQQVTVRAGQESRVTLELPTTGIASR